MKLFNYSFEQSQSFVNEDIVNKLNQKGNWKRYIGLLITSVVLYFFLVAIPMFISGHTVDQAPNYRWLQWPAIFLFLIMYLVYLFFSIKYRNSPMKLKFCTYFYMVILLSMFTVCSGIMMMTHRNMASIVAGVTFGLAIFYLVRTVPRKMKEAVCNRTEFSPMSSILTDRISDGLIFLGGTGITAGLVLFDRSTGSNTRGGIDAVLMPLMPAIFVFATYVFSIDLLRGYYLFKYSEEYREQFRYSSKAWYGEKSKEYRQSLNKETI